VERFLKLYVERSIRPLLKSLRARDFAAGAHRAALLVLLHTLMHRMLQVNAVIGSVAMHGAVGPGAVGPTWMVQWDLCSGTSPQWELGRCSGTDKLTSQTARGPRQACSS
jgi:hypothetical protein